MRVYLVWSGDYEQRGISGAFTTMEAAETFVKDSRRANDYDIEELEVKDVAPNWITIHEAGWNTNLGERVSSYHATDDFLGVEEAEEETHRYYYSVTVRAATRAEAVQQMRQLRTAWMERRGLTEIPAPNPAMRFLWYDRTVLTDP